MSLLLLNLLTLFFLLSSFLLTAVISAFRRIRKKESKKHLKSLGRLFFYRDFHLYFFPKHEFESVFFVSACAQNFARFCYGVSAAFLLINVGLFTYVIPGSSVTQPLDVILDIFSILGLMILAFFIGDFLPRILGNLYPEMTIRLCAPFASIFMFIVFPFAYVFLAYTESLTHTIYFDHIQEPLAKVKDEIIEIIQDADIDTRLDPHDKKLISSVMTFRDRVAREVMVPRVDIFSLPAELSIMEATKLLKAEGYSRTPVYRTNIDNIIGVLMYKDVLNKYLEYEESNSKEEILDAPIESIVKNVLYTPENKKISHLLQEFRKKQVHLAIVVDEYGGTEGIVTIEDILEEIVGEISDEYDEDEALFVAHPNGGWTVDARMNILDVEEQLGVKIPQEGEYDTLGGYIFHKAGTIPHRGFVIHHDDFEIEVLSSNERSIDKVRIRKSGVD